MYRYFYKLNNDGTIKALYKQKNTLKNGVEISAMEYNAYKDIIANVEQREGYEAIIKLYPDFTFTVEYTPIEVIEING